MVTPFNLYSVQSKSGFSLRVTVLLFFSTPAGPPIFFLGLLFRHEFELDLDLYLDHVHKNLKLIGHLVVG